MSKKSKLFLSISIGLNILLVLHLISEYTNKQEIKETVLFSEVYDNLEELEGTIANQINNDWTEPKLVTAQLEETISGFYLSSITSQRLGMLSDEEDRIMDNIYLELNSYLNKSYDLTEQSKEDLEQLRLMIREVGIGTDIWRGELNNVMKDIKEKLNKLSSIIIN
ncbi:hypothetical protein [Ornithinibacillus californiensis]|uniref:hypothetical protein n=1 Tax=Ornithinibacillus californiensis TaxID=161536 RepID=UPI00064D89DD|nr:hypothetical protein [Ornithinibacillus californiensis]